jgi:hypothetical protein
MRPYYRIVAVVYLLWAPALVLVALDLLTWGGAYNTLEANPLTAALPYGFIVLFGIGVVLQSAIDANGMERRLNMTLRKKRQRIQTS